MQVSRQTSDGTIRQIGTSLGPLDGCEVVELSDDQAAALQTALATAGAGSVTFDGEAFTVVPAQPTPETPPAPTAEQLVTAVVTAEDCPPGVASNLQAVMSGEG